MDSFCKILAIWLILDGILSFIYSTDKRFLSQATRIIRSILGAILFFG